MKTFKGSAVMTGLLYAQVLFGVAAIAIVLMRAPTEVPVVAVDTMAVSSIGAQPVSN